MANIKRSSIVGFHNIKNKVSRNAFDLSHRHMFTAQIGELLPIFVQWCNPNETFKLGYNGFTRTQPLQTAAFTRLKENVQYYFVPFQSLWKYFEQQVNNMQTGQSGENISRIALSFTSDSPITSGMPYLNYSFFSSLLSSELHKVSTYLVTLWNKYPSSRNLKFFTEQLAEEGYVHFGTLRYVRICKLLRALGYLNTDFDNYDVVSSVLAYGNTLSSSATMTYSGFQASEFGYFGGERNIQLTNSPNLSIFPLLAYHKIINDHYLYRQWQPYRSFLCNIDYLLPSDSMDFSSKVDLSSVDFFELEQSNLPLDYFNGVLPKAQYSEESAASIDLTSTATAQTTTLTYTGDSTVSSGLRDGTLVSESGKAMVDNGSIKNTAVIESPHRHNIVFTSGQQLGALKVSALRSAIALQKYKEIQESNDTDFASQVLAHFGVKPKHDSYKSYFIGGGDSVIDINPQVNQNLSDDNVADIKAIGAGQLSCGCKFTSDTYGVIIGIYRCTPQLDLAKVGLDRNLFKTDASDFPIPELDRVGMQTQYRCEVIAPRLGYKNGTHFGNETSLDLSTTYGYLPRYAELKTSYDRYEGAFLDSLRSWVTGYDTTALDNWLFRLNSNGVVDYPGINTLLQCTPSLTDSIFVDQSALCCNNDKLLIGSVNTCVAIRPFSVYGLPYSK